MKLNEKILKLRKEKGLSQEELANDLKVSRQSVSKWELGEASPELSKIVEMATYFNVSTDYLLLNKDMEVNVKSSANSNLANTIIFALGVLLFVTSIITAIVIPHDPFTNHNGIIAYLFEDWTTWGIVWRFALFLPSIVLMGFSTIIFFKRRKKQ